MKNNDSSRNVTNIFLGFKICPHCGKSDVSFFRDIIHTENYFIERNIDTGVESHIRQEVEYYSTCTNCGLKIKSFSRAETDEFILANYNKNVANNINHVLLSESGFEKVLFENQHGSNRNSCSTTLIISLGFIIVSIYGISRLI